MTRPVTFLILDSTGHGGLARTVVATANALVEHRDVRVVSVLRRASVPRYPLDPRVTHEVLVDETAGLSPKQRLQRARPTRLDPLPADRALSRLTDKALQRRLTRLDPGVLVSTRPTLHLAATAWRAPGVQLVGWDHRNFPTRMASPWLRDVLEAAVPQLDAYVVLTRADVQDYRRTMALPRTTVRALPNALSWPAADRPAPLDPPVVVAAGRLSRDKGFGRLIDAFAAVAPSYPGWTLRILGEGPLRERLEARVVRHGLTGRVQLPGHVHDVRGELAAASVFALTSRVEGFPMVLLEAMAEGLPLLAMDCPRGPGEIVDDDRNGFLVDDGDVLGFTDRLDALLGDPELRRRLGKQAWVDAQQYAPERVTSQWLSLLADLDARAAG